MNQYLLLFRGGNDSYAKFTETELSDDQKKWADWMGKLIHLGHSPMGQPLSRAAKVLKSGIYMDAPFGATPNDVIVGYVVVTALDFTSAVKAATDCPIIGLGGSVEIREIQSE